MKKLNNITRRNFFKLLTISAGTTVVSCSSTNIKQNKTKRKQLLLKNKDKKRVVVVGGGIGGLCVAENIKIYDSKDEIEVIVLERNSHYFTCPMSNTLFGEIKEVQEAKIPFLYNYTLVEKNHKIDVIITEVISADRKNKTLETTSGVIDYDYVVVAPGIGYNYKSLFPKWSEAKIRRATKETPAAMHSDSGKEKYILLSKLLQWKKDGGKGYFVIVTPKGGKQRCKPASYERACMISEFIKKYKLPGKVYIMDNSPKPKSKGSAFIDIFIKHHKDTILFNGMDGNEMLKRIEKAGFNKTNFKKKENFSKVEDIFATAIIEDVDFDKKEIIFKYADNFDDDAKEQKLKYAIANIIPYHKGNETANLFDVKQDGWGGIVCAPNKIYSETDSSVYVAGDIIGYHKFDPSAQASVTVGALTGESIVKRILTNKDEIDLSEAGITCFSMVSCDPLTAIGISKNMKIDKEGRAVPLPTAINFIDGASLIGWFQSMVEAPFKY